MAQHSVTVIGVRARRERLGLTQAQLAFQVDPPLAARTIWAAETHGRVSRATAARIAVALGVRPDELFAPARTHHRPPSAGGASKATAETFLTAGRREVAP